MLAQKWNIRTDDITYNNVVLTPKPRHFDVIMSFWRNDYVIIA